MAQQSALKLSFVTNDSMVVAGAGFEPDIKRVAVEVHEFKDGVVGLAADVRGRVGGGRGVGAWGKGGSC